MDNRTKRLESLRSTLERKASDFENVKQKSIEAAKSGMHDLRTLMDFVESNILKEIEETFEVNKFANALERLNENEEDISESEANKLGNVAAEDIPTRLGPSKRDFLRGQETIIGLNSWYNKRSLHLPEHIEGKCVGADCVEVVWDKVCGAVIYQVEMRRPNEGAFCCAYEGNETSYRLSGLCAGTRVLFRLRSVFGDGRLSEWSECVEASTTTTASSQYLFAEGKSESEIAVHWDIVEAPGDDDEALTYHVEMRPKNKEGTKFKEVYSGSYNRCTVRELEAEEEYLFRVKTTCGDRLINQSNIVLGKTKLPIPKKFRVRTNNWDEIAITWNPVVSKTGFPVSYVVEGKGENESEFNEIYDGARTKIRKTEFQQDTEYSFRIRSKCVNEVSEWSDVLSVRTQRIPDFSESVWKECPDYVQKNIKYFVDEVNSRIATKIGDDDMVSFGHCTVIGNIPLPPNKVTLWNIKNRNGRCYIGVAPLDINQNEKNNQEKCGWYFYCCDSTLWSGPPHNYRDNQYGPNEWEMHYAWTENISAVMDTTKGNLSFALDGVNLGVAYERIPLDKPLIPCVILESHGAFAELDFSEVKENVDSSISAPSEIDVKRDKLWDSLIFTWDKVNTASFYQVKIERSNFLNISTTNMFIKRGLLADTEYSFRVRTVKGYSVSEWSDIVRGKTGKESLETSGWKECPDYDTKEKMKYFISKSNPRIVTKREYCVYCFIMGNTPLPLNRTTYWSIKILNSEDVCQNTIYLGITPLDTNPNDKNYVKCGWYFDFCRSKLWSGAPHNYIGKQYGSRKGEGKYVYIGDLIGFIMDTTKGELSFAFNESNLGVAYERIPLDKPLVPCVILGGGYKSVELVSAEVEKSVLNNSIPIPSNITIKGELLDSITLTWDTIEGAPFYQIEINGNKLSGIDSSNMFTKKGLLPDTEYSFRVRTVIGNEVSEWSDAVKGRTLKKSFETCAWEECPAWSHKGINYFVDEINTRIATSIENRYEDCVIIGDTSIPLNRIVSWNIKILDLKNNDGNGILVGVAPSDINQYDDIERCIPGWYFNCYRPSELYSRKKCESRHEDRKHVQIGDSIGVVMNTVCGNLSFIVGGINQGVAYDEIPLDKPLVPCVRLRNKGDSVELDSVEVKENKANTSIPVPSNITAKSITWDSITLKWDAVEGASFYQIESDENIFRNTPSINTFMRRGFSQELNIVSGFVL